MAAGETKTIPCAQANPGYVVSQQKHSGFHVTCNQGTLRIGPQGGRCGAYPKCLSMQAQASLVCGATSVYDPSRGSMPYRSKADCCVSPGGVSPVQPPVVDPGTGNPPIGNPPIGNPPIGGPIGGGGGIDVCPSLTCLSMMMYTGQNAQCNQNMMQGGSNVILDGQCRPFSGGGQSIGYYRLLCLNNQVTGVYSCTSPACAPSSCAVSNFALLGSQLERCVSKQFDCLPGRPDQCLTADFMFSTQMCFASNANTWAVNTLGAALPIAGLAMADL